MIHQPILFVYVSMRALPMAEQLRRRGDMGAEAMVMMVVLVLEEGVRLPNIAETWAVIDAVSVCHPTARAHHQLCFRATKCV
jgi:hypothetical protein